MANYTGGPGDDTRDGTSGADTFDYSQGGNDTLNGRGGDDVFVMGGALTALDSIDGGAGADTVSLSGDYSALLTFSATTMINVETLQLAAGHDYALATDDATVAANRVLTVDAGALGAANHLTFDGSAETDGRFAVTGGAGDDTLTGGQGDDTFAGGDGSNTYDLSRGGDDTVTGGSNETFVMGAAFTASDRIDASGTMYLDGDYSSQLSISSLMLGGGSTLDLAAGHDYNLRTAGGTYAFAGGIAIHGDQLLSTDALHFNGQSLTGVLTAWDGAGDDTIQGGASQDIFTVTMGGNDIAQGNGGNDTFDFGGSFGAGDTVDGGNGIDTLRLDGDYSTHLAINSGMLRNVEQLELGGGHNYDLQVSDSVVAAGSYLAVDARQLSGSDTVNFRGGKESDGNFLFYGGSGTNIFHGGDGPDQFNMVALGTRIVSAGAGNDFIEIRNFSSADSIDGGAGYSDIMLLYGDYSAGLSINSGMMRNIETLSLTGGESYKFQTSDLVVASGHGLTIDATALLSTDTLSFNGSKETDGQFIFMSGHGADTFTGGAITDFFAYSSASQSTGALHDTIHALDFDSDKFDLSGSVSAIDAAVTTGLLRSAHFDSDLSAAVSSLGANDAMLFTPDSGNQAGHTFLVVDFNGTAGYQAGEDLVVDVTGYSGTLDTSDFV